MIQPVLNYYGHDTVFDYYNGVAGQLLLSEPYRHTFHLEYINIEKLPQFLIDAPTVASDVDSTSFKEIKTYKNGHILCHRGEIENQSYDIYGFYPTAELMKQVYDELKSKAPKSIVKENETKIHFWYLEKQAKRTIKTIETPSWTEINQNYPLKIRDDLTSLVNLNPENLSGGKLILWRGLPGTGKTWAIRSLTNTWKNWCTPHYIIDMENFLGSSVNYMLGMISKINSNAEEDDDDLVIDPVWTPKKKWNLLILEDAGEFIASDAKGRSGGALTKLLNIGDGLLGQGMNLLILITTNEELSDIHQAVSRQGRCLSNLEFPSFEKDEAKQWLTNHNYTGEIPSSTTLSDLYYTLPNAKRTVVNKTATKKKMGFV